MKCKAAFILIVDLSFTIKSFHSMVINVILAWLDPGSADMGDSLASYLSEKPPA